MDFYLTVADRFPQELVDEVVNNLDNPRDLSACSLVSSKWLEGSRRRLFEKVSLNTWNFDKWRRNIPPGPSGISAYVRSLSLRQARSIVSLGPETLMRIMDHLTSFRSLKTLFLQDVNFDELFNGPSLAKCFGHFGSSVRSLHLHGVRTDMGTLLFFINLFPHLNRLTITSPTLTGGVPEAPKEAHPLNGTLRLSDLGTTSQTLLCGILLIPLRLEEISITHTRIADSENLNKLIDMCSPTLKKLELAHVTSGACHAYYVGNSFTDDDPLDNEGNPVPVSLSPCLALREFATNTTTIKRPSVWIEATLSTISFQATQLKRVVINVHCQLTSPDIDDQVHTEAWESLEDVLYGLALKLESDSKFELVFVANPTYDEEQIDLGEFLERLAEVAVVKFDSVR